MEEIPGETVVFNWKCDWKWNVIGSVIVEIWCNSGWRGM